VNEIRRAPLQRFAAVTERDGYVADPSRPSWSHRLLQSLIGIRASGLMRLPAPGSPSSRASRTGHPVFTRLPRPANRSISPDVLSWSSALLHGTTRPPCPRRSGRERLSWGFSPLQRIRWRESTSRPVPKGRPARPPPPGGCGNPPPVPTPAATVSLAGFLNPSATSSSLRRPAIFRRVALLGFRPTGAPASREAPPTRRRRPALLTFLPRFARTRSLGSSAGAPSVA
jgi:hypothetical protein